MKLMVAGIVMTMSAADGSAQNCKPDISSEDRITKQRIEVWRQSLYETGLLSAALTSTSDWEITASIGQYGSLYALNLQLEDREESVARAELESTFRAAEGNQFWFGLSDGEPLAFVATEVRNESRASGMTGRLITTVVLSAHVDARDLAAIREALTTHRIDAVRVRLVGDMTVEKPINDGNGDKMRQKFACFYGAQDERGVDLLAAGGSADPGGGSMDERTSRAVGRYEHIGAGDDALELRGDGTWVLRQSGKGYDGSFRVSGDTVIMTQRNGPTFPGGVIDGDRILDADGSVWQRRHEDANRPEAVLTLAQIEKMVAVGLSDDIIIASITRAGAKFDLTPEDLVRLKEAGVSDAVLKAMIR